MDPVALDAFRDERRREDIAMGFEGE